MDAVDYHRLADQLGACAEERDHELANAHWDLQHRPETALGRDAYTIAADALTAVRARPQPQLAEVHFLHHSWTPGGLTADHYGPTSADEVMQWYQVAAGRP